MQNCWLAQENRSSCILFLSGWGMDPAPFRSIPVKDHDLLMVYDYRGVEPSSVIEQVQKYTSIHLVSWSMGVWIAGQFFSSHTNRFASATAINGTLKPIDDTYGIPRKVYYQMIRDFSAASLEQFYDDMFYQASQVQRFLDNRPRRSQKSIAVELETLKKMYEEHGAGDDIFTTKIVASRDRIFHAKSQLRSWGKEDCTRIKAAHFPFYDWTSWDVIIPGGSLDSCA